MAHIEFIQRTMETRVWPPHLLYHVTVYAISGFSRNYDSLAGAGLVLLSACLIAKAWLSYAAFCWYRPSNSTPEAAHGAHLSCQMLASIIVIGLLVCAPLVRPWQANHIYLGQISGSVWHNPTCILCWPIVIALFFAAVEFLRMPNWQMLVAVGLLSALSVLAKPNYFLAFAPVFSLFCASDVAVSQGCGP